MPDIRLKNDNYEFLYRTSVILFNKDETKVLLFNSSRRDFYMLPGGKIAQKENSLEAIKRELKEETGYINIDYSFLGISEEFANVDNKFYQQLSLIYKGILNENIEKEEFKGLEGDWCNFKWVDIDKIDDYKISPKNIKNYIKNPNKIYHNIENLDNEKA